MDYACVVAKTMIVTAVSGAAGVVFAGGPIYPSALIGAAGGAGYGFFVSLLLY